jgi:dolichol kinase
MLLSYPQHAYSCFLQHTARELLSLCVRSHEACVLCLTHFTWLCYVFLSCSLLAAGSLVSVEDVMAACAADCAAALAGFVAEAAGLSRQQLEGQVGCGAV